MEKIEQSEGDLIVARRPWQQRLWGIVPVSWGIVALLIAVVENWAGFTDPLAPQIALSLCAGFLIALGIEISKPRSLKLVPSTRKFSLRLGWRTVIRGDLDAECGVEVETVFDTLGRPRWLVRLRLADDDDRLITVLSTSDADAANKLARGLSRRLRLRQTRFCRRFPPASFQEVAAGQIGDLRRGMQKPRAEYRRLLCAPLPTEVQRLDDEELKVSAPPKRRRLALFSLPLALAIVAAATWRWRVITDNSDLQLGLVSAWLARALSYAGLIGTCALAAPSWSSLRFRDRLFRARVGWLYSTSRDMREIKSLVVERPRRPFFRAQWVVSMKRLNYSMEGHELIPIIALRTAREARAWVDDLSLRTGLQVVDLSGALPSAASFAAEAARAQVSAKHEETPEQIAARDSLDVVVNRHRPFISLWRGMTSLGAIATILGSAVNAWTLTNERAGTPSDALWIAIPVVLMFSGVIGWYASQAHLGNAIGKIDSVAAVGPMLDLAGESSVGNSAPVQEALAKLLKRVRPADGRTFSAAQRQTLRSLATNSPYRFAPGQAERAARLRSACLSALEQIGDEQDIAALENLLARTSSERAREEISTCLHAIYTRDEAMRPGQNLLRAVEAAVDGDELLRPVIGTNTQDTSNLLRPTEPEELTIQTGA